MNPLLDGSEKVELIDFDDDSSIPTFKDSPEVRNSSYRKVGSSMPSSFDKKKIKSISKKTLVN